MSQAEATGAMTALRADLESLDLTILLHRMTDPDIDGLARILAEMPKLDVLNRCVTGVALQTLGLRGKTLIPAIVKDLCWLASPKIGSSKSYRQVLQAVARRHDIMDDSKSPPSQIERALQSQYAGRLRPDPREFTERVGTTRLAKLAAQVTAAAFPNARIVTAAVLEIAALRRIALMRELAGGLEAM